MSKQFFNSAQHPHSKSNEHKKTEKENVPITYCILELLVKAGQS